MAAQQTEKLVGFCLGCHYAHLKSETQTIDGVLRCKETGQQVERFANPRLMAAPQQPRQFMRPLAKVRERTIVELMSEGLFDVVYHAGIDLGKNREVLEEIVRKLADLLPESEREA